MSVATWSLRERAVCSLPPTGPASSVSRRSIAMWTSSSSGRNGNVPSLQLVLDRVERREQLVAVLGAAMIPCAASMRACARDWSTS